MNEDGAPEAEKQTAPPAEHDLPRRGWRLRFETVGSISAIVVGVAALFVSWDQARVMRQEIRASLWPALQIDGFADTLADRITTVTGEDPTVEVRLVTVDRA